VCRAVEQDRLAGARRAQAGGVLQQQSRGDRDRRRAGGRPGDGERGTGWHGDAVGAGRWREGTVQGGRTVAAEQRTGAGGVDGDEPRRLALAADPLPDGDAAVDGRTHGTAGCRADRRPVAGTRRAGQGDGEVCADGQVGLVVLRAVPGGVEGDPERAGRAGQADQQARGQRVGPAGGLERGQRKRQPAGGTRQPFDAAQRGRGHPQRQRGTGGQQQRGRHHADRVGTGAGAGWLAVQLPPPGGGQGDEHHVGTGPGEQLEPTVALDRARDREHRRECQRSAEDRDDLYPIDARTDREPGAGQRREMAEAGVQRGRRGYPDRRGEDGERAALGGRHGGELAAADSQRGQQCGLAVPHTGGEPTGQRQGGRGQHAAEDRDGEYGGGGDPLLVAGVPQGERQPGLDPVDPHPVAERAFQPAVGGGHGAGDGVQVAAAGAGQVGPGGDLQPGDERAAAEQVGQVDEERAVGADRSHAAAVLECRVVAGAGERVAVPAGAWQRSRDSHDGDVERGAGVDGEFFSNVDAAAGSEAERPRGGLQDDGLPRSPWPAPGRQRGA
jgi:hypothetical protein